MCVLYVEEMSTLRYRKAIMRLDYYVIWIVIVESTLKLEAIQFM